MYITSSTGEFRVAVCTSARGTTISVDVKTAVGGWSSATVPAPILSGEAFALTTQSRGVEGATATLSGVGTNRPFVWRLAVETTTGWLAFELTIDSDGFDIGHDAPQPGIQFDLGALPPYERGNHFWFTTNVSAPSTWNRSAAGNDFPGAYYFDPYRRCELELFVDLGASTWFGEDSALRLYEYTCGVVRSFRPEPSAEFGFIGTAPARMRSFPRGRHVLRWYVAARRRDDLGGVSPTEQDALRQLVADCLRLVDTPTDEWHGSPGAWADAAASAAGELMSDGLAWRSDDLGDYLLAYVDARSDAWSAAFAAKGETWNGDGPCLDAALWLLRPLQLLRATTAQSELAKLTDRVDDFATREAADPRSRILSGRHDAQTEMGTWQYVYLLADTWYLYGESELRERILAEIESVLIPLAHRVGYNFPLSFDKSALAKLGPGGNAGSAGTYAMLMASLAASESDPERYTEEARRALRALANLHIDDVPQEAVLAPHAMVAADELARQEPGGEWAELREYFLAQTLRAMYWYDDPLPVGAVRGARIGMFQACTGIVYPAFFEDVEVAVRLASVVDRERDPRGLLRVLDRARRVNVGFLPAFGSEPDSFTLPHIPFEELPMLDGARSGGSIGQEIYGAGWLYWAHLLWDALAVSDNPQVMVLNADPDPGRAGTPGRFVAYNGTDVAQEATIRFTGAGTTVDLQLASGAWEWLSASA
ncbi:hypothetical protein [Microbacterium candidum]|uniref:Glycosyl hydrolase 36 catalytic domain-containing protein n=1 Tax=Microbacterium candidum TaxID=3041922 RepID=A0ABT7MWD1_9MICO|nr:hypothetical protein [Microbacterium sp. ASV49]MDL9978733.1 hypothetical protein [Microbacterium sp. ASV49]